MDEDAIFYTHLFTTEEKLKKLGLGEWCEEPDKAEGRYKGYRFEIHRNMLFTGSLCGYIKLLPTHPWIGQDYEEIATSVHGGITFLGDFEDERHDLKENWAGFDTSHGGDLCPYIIHHENLMKTIMPDYPAFSSQRSCKLIYRNMEYVLTECKKLIHEAIEAEKIPH